MTCLLVGIHSIVKYTSPSLQTPVEETQDLCLQLEDTCDAEMGKIEQEEDSKMEVVEEKKKEDGPKRIQVTTIERF